MSKESMARITSPDAAAKRKANPWTLARRDEYLKNQTSEDVYRKREIFAQINQAKEVEDAAEYLQAIENQANKGKHHVNSNHDTRRVGNREIDQPAQHEGVGRSAYSGNQEAAPLPF